MSKQKNFGDIVANTSQKAKQTSIEDALSYLKEQLVETAKTSNTAETSDKNFYAVYQDFIQYLQQAFPDKMRLINDQILIERLNKMIAENINDLPADDLRGCVKRFFLNSNYYHSTQIFDAKDFVHCEAENFNANNKGLINARQYLFSHCENISEEKHKLLANIFLHGSPSHLFRNEESFSQRLLNTKTVIANDVLPRIGNSGMQVRLVTPLPKWLRWAESYKTDTKEHQRLLEDYWGYLALRTNNENVAMFNYGVNPMRGYYSSLQTQMNTRATNETFEAIFKRLSIALPPDYQKLVTARNTLTLRILELNDSIKEGVIDEKSAKRIFKTLVKNNHAQEKALLAIYKETWKNWHKATTLTKEQQTLSKHWNEALALMHNDAWAKPENNFKLQIALTQVAFHLDKGVGIGCIQAADRTAEFVIEHETQLHCALSQQSATEFYKATKSNVYDYSTAIEFSVNSTFLGTIGNNIGVSDTQLKSLGNNREFAPTRQLKLLRNYLKKRDFQRLKSTDAPTEIVKVPSASHIEEAKLETNEVSVMTQTASTSLPNSGWRHFKSSLLGLCVSLGLLLGFTAANASGADDLNKNNEIIAQTHSAPTSRAPAKTVKTGSENTSIDTRRQEGGKTQKDPKTGNENSLPSSTEKMGGRSEKRNTSLNKSRQKFLDLYKSDLNPSNAELVTQYGLNAHSPTTVKSERSSTVKSESGHPPSRVRAVIHRQT